MAHIGSININIDTSQVVRASTAIKQLGNDAAATQTLLNRLSTINLGPTSASANTLAQQLNNVGQQATTALTQLNALSSAGGSLGGSIGGASSSVSGLVQSLTGLSAGPQMLLAIGASAISMGKSMYEAYQPVQSLTMGLQALGTDGVSGVMALRASADKVGMDFIGASKAMLQLTAATAGTKLEGAKTAHMFESVSNAIKLTGGTTEDANRAFLALSQMLSKGTVQSQELKLQLGNSLPGAMRLASDAMGMTMDELVKTMEMGSLKSEGFVEKFVGVLDTKFGGGMERAASTTQSQLNICSNDWQMFSANAGKSIDGLLGSLAQLINQTRILRALNLSGVIGDANDSNAAAAGRQGMGQYGAETLASYKIQALQQSGYKGKIKTTQMETDAFGNVTERKLSAEEVWAGIAGDAYTNKDEKLTAKIAAINTKMNDWKGDQEKAAKLKKEQEKKEANAKWETDYYRRMAVAKREGNQHAVGLLEAEKKRRELDLQLRGADGDPIEQERLRAKNAAEVAGLEHKGIRKPKRKPKLSETEKQDNAFNSLWDSMAHSIDRTEVAKETSWLDQELVKQNQIWEKNNEKAKHALDAKKINQSQYQKLIDESARMFAEGSSNVIQTDANKREEEKQKSIAKFLDEQVKLATSLRKIDLQRQKDLENILTTHRNITDSIREEEAANNPMNSKEENNNFARNKYVKDKVSPLQSKADAANDTVNAMRAELDITVATAEELTKFENATNLAAIANRELAQAQDDVSHAFDRQLAKTESWQLSLSGAANKWIQTTDTAKMQADLATSTVQDFGNTLLAATGSRDDWHHREDHMKKYFTSILKNISQLVIQLGVVRPLMASLFGGDDKAGGGGGIGKLFNLAMGAFQAYTAPVEGDANFMGPIMPKANGGAFNKGVEFFANGGVFDSPTMFKHSSGLGVLGEAGPESIMPLKRGKDGKLGVVASGGGSSINHNNFSPTIVIQGNADDAAIAKMRAEMAAEFKQYTRQQIAMNNKQSQRPGGIAYRG